MTTNSNIRKRRVFFYHETVNKKSTNNSCDSVARQTSTSPKRDPLRLKRTSPRIMITGPSFIMCYNNIGILKHNLYFLVYMCIRDGQNAYLSFHWQCLDRLNAKYLKKSTSRMVTIKLVGYHKQENVGKVTDTDKTEVVQ